MKTIQFRDKKPRFIAKDDRWYICGERDLVEMEYEDRDRNYFSRRQEILQEERDADNLKLYGHY